MGVSSTKARFVVAAHTSHIHVSVSLPEALQAHQIHYTLQFGGRLPHALSGHCIASRMVPEGTGFVA